MRWSEHGRIYLKQTNLMMTVAVLLIGAANLLWAERLTFNGGLGWDGFIYAGWVKDFGNVVSRGVSDYHAQRILPSAIVHYGMRLFSVPTSNKNIIFAFDFYNLVLLAASAYFWGKSADKLKLSDRGKWFGFFFLFLNYAILKNNFYHSVLTDTSAFAIGVLTLYFYLANSATGLLAITVVGGLVWPTAPYISALLCAFPYARSEMPKPETAARRRLSRTLGTIAAAVVSALTLAALMRFVYRLDEVVLRYPPTFLRIDRALVYVSVIAVVVYLFFGLRAVLSAGELFDVRRLRDALNWRRALMAVLALLAVWALRRVFWNGQVTQWGTTKSFIVYTLLSSLTEPLIFLVAHAIYFGPAILLLVLFWRPFCHHLSEYGIGLRLLVVVNVLLSINPQSRYQINILAIFVAVLIKLLDSSVLKKQYVWAWLLLCLVFSKVWYVMNTAPQVHGGGMQALLSFPLQHYFMNSGTWMSKAMYYAQGGAVALTAIVLFFLLRHHRRELYLDTATASQAKPT